MLGKISYRKANYVLVAVIILCNLYVLVLPLLPRVSYELNQRVFKPIKVDSNNKSTLDGIDRTKNHVVIPAIQLDEDILEGQDPNTVNSGVWRRPETSTPKLGSNTVLVGHRFTYSGAAEFYNLDKLPHNADVYYVYQGQIYHYVMSESLVVAPEAIEIESATMESRLTLYTCTPLLTAENRLVFRGELRNIL